MICKYCLWVFLSLNIIAIFYFVELQVAWYAIIYTKKINTRHETKK